MITSHREKEREREKEERTSVMVRCQIIASFCDSVTLLRMLRMLRQYLINFFRQCRMQKAECRKQNGVTYSYILDRPNGRLRRWTNDYLFSFLFSIPLLLSSLPDIGSSDQPSCWSDSLQIPLGNPIPKLPVLVCSIGWPCLVKKHIHPEIYRLHPSHVPHWFEALWL